MGSLAAGKVERAGEVCVQCASKITFSHPVFMSVHIWITSAGFCSWGPIDILHLTLSSPTIHAKLERLREAWWVALATSCAQGRLQRDAQLSPHWPGWPSTVTRSVHVAQIFPALIHSPVNWCLTPQHRTTQGNTTQHRAVFAEHPPRASSVLRTWGQREQDRQGSFPRGSVIRSAGAAAGGPSGCGVEGAPCTQEVGQSGVASPAWLSNAGEVLIACWGMWSRLVEKARE